MVKVHGNGRYDFDECWFGLSLGVPIYRERGGWAEFIGYQYKQVPCSFSNGMRQEYIDKSVHLESNLEVLESTKSRQLSTYWFCIWIVIIFGVHGDFIVIVSAIVPESIFLRANDVALIAW